jgi:hypothetical protein
VDLVLVILVLLQKKQTLLLRSLRLIFSFDLCFWFILCQVYWR